MPAAQASTGEQKALLVGILLAHADLAADRTGRVPLLLLDEAAAHLDPDRRRALFGRLLALGGQAWLTGTEMPLFDGLPEASRFAVAGGAVTAA
jgi:DNA replication and repair protein RecF